MNLLKYILIFTIIFLTSCATYQNGLVRNERVKMTEEIMKSFNMTFSSKSYKYSLHKRKFELEEQDLISVLTRSNNSLSDSTKYKSYRIQFVGIDTLLVQGVDFKDSIVTNWRFHGKLRKNGFFHLSNKLVEFHRIPYLFGGSRSEKTRIGLSKDNELIIQTAIDNTGAILFVIGTGYSYNIATFFKEVK